MKEEHQKQELNFDLVLRKMESEKSEVTVKIYSHYLRKLEKYCEQKNIIYAEDFSVSDVVDFTDKHLRGKPSRFFFKYFLTFYNRSDLKNYVFNWKIKEKNKKKIYTVEKELVYKMVDEAKFIRDKILILLCYENALRIGEALSLSPEDIDFKEKTIKVRTLKRRDGSYRTLMLSDELYNLLRSYLKAKGYIRDDGTTSLEHYNVMQNKIIGVSYEIAVGILKKIAEKVGKPNLRFHLLRHSQATALRNPKDKEMMPLEDLQIFLGHQSMSSTQQYLHPTNERMQKFSKQLIGRDK